MVATAQAFDNRAVLAKIERARSRLMASDAFFGTLALKLRIRVDTRFPLMATDGTHLFYNPQGCAAASEPELIFVWAHEILHCGLCHMYRKPSNIDWHEWNVCTDLAINDLLIIKGTGAKPAGILHDVRYRNLSAEQIAHARRKARQQAQDEQAARDAEQTAQDAQDAGDSDSDTDEDGEQDDTDGSEDGEQGQDADDAAGDEDEQAGDGSEQDGTGEDDADGTDPTASEPSGADAGSDSDGSDGTGDAGDTDEDASGTDAGEPTLGDGTLEPGDDCLPPCEPGAGDSDAGEPDTDANTQTDWEMAVEQAAAVSRKAGEMDGGIERVIAGTRTTRTDWREVLRRFVESTSPSDYTWQRPNRRYLSQGLYLPGVHKANTPPIVVVVDTSGSVGQDELDVFATELTNILTDCKPRSVHVIYCDTRVNGDAEVFTPDDGAVVLTTRGGGGTYFQPAFDWVADACEDGTLDERPAAILYLTDGYAADLYTLTEPDVPTLFAIVPGGTTDMPFGDAIEMEID